MKGFSPICSPLHRLVEKGKEFQWSDECQKAFDTLRHRLTTPPIIAFPDFTKEFILDTDASDSGLGTVLSQVHEGKEHVIAYASKSLSKTERNYSVTRRELLAVVIFTAHFRQYLLGTKFKLRTDHNSLKWLQSFKQPEGQLARWLEKLSEYSFTVEHRHGRKHGNADALSRKLPVSCTQMGTESLLGHTSAAMRCLQLEDATIGPVRLKIHVLSGQRIEFSHNTAWLHVGCFSCGIS